MKLGPAKSCAPLVLAALVACATPTRQGRFVDQPIVWRVNDAQDIPEPTYRDHTTVFDKIVRAVDPPPRKPAQNTNALDEVPDSTWFTNRIACGRLTPEKAIDGPVVSGPPERPLTIVEGKIEGASPGFLIDDARGIRYLVKFDTPQNPEQKTAAAVIANRIFWALGYNVPPDHLVFFTREELRLAPGIDYRDPNSKQMRRLDWQRVDEILTNAARRSDGAYRAVMSQLLRGKRKGGFAPKGIRADDPNDRIPHQYRRELRGLRVFAAWLGHTDVTQGNSLDMYVIENGSGFLRHYLLDFDGAFGGHQSELGRLEVGWEHSWDLESQAKATMTFGTWTRTWERQEPTPYRATGYFSSKYYDPTKWREFTSYAPFSAMDRADAYWAAKLVMRFDRKMLEALVAEGQLSEPGAAGYLVDTLLERRDATGATFLEAVTPLDEFHFERGALCAVDLSMRYGFADQGMVVRLDERDHPVAGYPVSPSGRVCLPVDQRDVYRVLRLRMRRGEKEKPVLQIHYRGGPRARILGVIRDE